MRSHEFRYTAWLPWLDKTKEADWTAEPFRELYDHRSDTGADFDAMDTVNVAYTPSFEKITTAMHAQCRYFFHVLLPPTGPGSGGGNHSSTKLTKKECDKAGGILDKDKTACCPTKCGQCGGQGCASAPGGKMDCCGKEVETHGHVCGAKHTAPCHAGGPDK